MTESVAFCCLAATLTATADPAALLILKGQPRAEAVEIDVLRPTATTIVEPATVQGEPEAPSSGVLAQESTFDGIVGAGILVVDDGGWATAELGLNAWLSPGFGIGAQHSIQSDGTEWAQLTSVKLNFRTRLNGRTHVLFGWSPFLSSIQEDDGHEVGVGVYPLFDVFLRIGLPGRDGLSIQGGVNALAARGGWVHPMMLGVFSF